MRVALDCRMADWSGVGRYTTGLARAVAATGDVEIVQVTAPGAEPPVPDAESLSAPGNPFTIAGGLSLAAALRRTHADLAHCPHFPTPLPAPHPLVVTLHDLTPLIIPAAMPSPLKRAVYRWWNARDAKAADAVTVNSRNTGADIERFFPAARGKVHVIPHALDPFATFPAGPLPSDLEGGPYVLSMGNTKPHKGLPTLLRAFAALATSRPGLRLLLVGADSPRFAASVLGGDPAAGRVTFTGAVDDATLRALYANAAVFAFPSLYEGFGLPVLEAMALGAPVVCSNAASLPEVAGDAALTFPAGDAEALAGSLGAVLDGPELHDTLAAAGRERAALFTWEETARRTVNLYREVLA
jgi:glycosyltransferase involved in cell wall biosynthesis